MSADFEIARPLPGAALRRDAAARAAAVADHARWPAGGSGRGRRPAADPGSAARSPASPQLLLDLSRLFGPEVEDYRYTLTSASSGAPDGAGDLPGLQHGAELPPAAERPEPPLTADGRLPVQYPHRNGWHTDQSYRRPPPDISLFFAVTPVARERGQTLFADGTLAYDALPAALKAQVERLQGLHAQPGTGRVAATPCCRQDADARFAPHERSQRQPVVRIASGDRQKRALSLRMRPDGLVRRAVRRHGAGPHGDGAALLDELMSALHAARVRLCPRMDRRATCWSGTIAAWSTPRPGTTPRRNSA